MARIDPKKTISLRIVILLTIFVCFLSTRTTGAAEIEVWMPDTTVAHRVTTVEIPIFMDNHTDTISAFSLHIVLSKPGILAFPATEVSQPDTSYWVGSEFDQYGVCIDSSIVPNDSVVLACRTFDWRYINSVNVWEIEIDTAGTLVAGWDIVDAVSLTGPEGLEVMITGRYDSVGGPYTGGIPYAEDPPLPLLNLIGELQELSDTLSDSTVHLQFVLNDLSDCSFTDRSGDFVAAATDTIPDTAFFDCGATWGPADSCLYWLRTTGLPADSTKITEHYLPTFDLSLTSVTDGSLTVVRDCCGLYTNDFTGNTNCSSDGLRTLSDISRLIDHLYISKAPLCCHQEGNTNGDIEGKITLSDISKLIDNIYISHEQTAPCQ